MPHASTRSRGSRTTRTVKQEALAADIRSQGLSPPTEADYGENDLVSNAARRMERSDAPPSEHCTESEPILVEIRDPRPVAVSSPGMSNEKSFFHSSFQDIGKKLKECNDTLGELQQLGVSHVVQLPELVLVGDQSAGKSSIMSGLANLDLPRSEGTCTRCPMHIRVSRNNDWSCRVSLRKDYSYQPPADATIRDSDVTDSRPFYPWIKRRIAVTEEFKTMHDHGEIDEVLRWAQIAILNDDKPHTLFVPGSGAVALSYHLAKAAEDTAAKFSPNIVALEIKGPQLPDLSFYDMPGIFQNSADARDDYLVKVVRNLSKSFMMHPSAIIMCSMPMNSDAANSATLGLINRLDASSRTIGVLTKADLLPEGSDYDQWLSIMNGRTHKTGLGYFITSRPQGKDLEGLKEWESRFFETRSSERWPDSFHPFAARCGVEKLKDFLSERLGEEFAKNLPKIKQKVDSNLDRIKQQLAKLPELPNNVEMEVRTSLMDFTIKINEKIDDFTMQFSSLPQSFRDCLLHIKPKFILKDRSDEVFEISSDESESGLNRTPNRTPKNKRVTVPVHTPSKRARLDLPAVQVKPEDAATPPALNLPTQRRNLLPEPFSAFSDIGRGFRTLRKVREDIEARKKAGMPDRISDKVYVDLVQDAIKPWQEPTKTFLQQTMTDLHQSLDVALNEALNRLKKRFIYREAKKYVLECLGKHLEATEAVLMQQYNHERMQLLTFNEELFVQYRNDERILLSRFRHKMRLDAAGKPRPLINWENMTEDQRKADLKAREQELQQLGPDPFDRELEVVAYVRGYYRLAAMRFVDAAAQSILCRMIPDIRADLPRFLEDKLRLRSDATPDIYTRLMEEDDATASNRERLKANLVRFEKARESIKQLESAGACVTDSSTEEDQTQAMPLADAMDVDGDEY